ncbi:glutaredoxin 3 [Thalassotalea loyana]|uniref:Glutaredoxin 3 n=1 Tax=Thalassotalea loyana TaxID=280483 RepID=A0ABQ6HEW6_9GAMM|nr:glutaredoxin domain-containing protein [Thalassotalea loyana]GLX86638.1 glutaredoxin 3 [Thalassotalea loyana]
MPKIKVYSKGYCPYCSATKQIMDKLGWQYQEIDVSTNKAALKEMIVLSARRTVPQIFIDDQHIGGYDDFRAYLKSVNNASVA